MLTLGFNRKNRGGKRPTRNVSLDLDDWQSQGLVRWYPLGVNGAGPVARDLSPRRDPNILTPSAATPMLIDPEWGPVLDLSGGTTYLETGTISDPGWTVEPITLMFWGKIATQDSGCGLWVGDASKSNEFFTVGGAVSPNFGSYGYIRNGATASITSAGWDYDYGWQHFVAKLSASNLYVYCNGGNEASIAAPALCDVFSIAIGRVNDSSPGIEWNGQIGDARVYAGRDFSVDEMAAFYDRGTRFGAYHEGGLRTFVFFSTQVSGATLKQVADTAAGADSVSQVSASTPIADQGAGADSVSSISVQLTVADAGSAGENVAHDVALVESDTAGAADVVSADVALGLADSASAADTPTPDASLDVTDAASGVDVIAQLSAALGITDAGTAAEVIGLLKQSLKQVADSGGGADAIAEVAVDLTQSESGSVVDAVNVLQSLYKQVTDTGTGSDNEPGIGASVTVTDTGTAVDDEGNILRLSLSRISGLSPVAIFFNAQADTGFAGKSFPYHEIRYDWDFDDSGSGYWPFSLRSRNTDQGPVAGHLYTKAGTYYPTCTARSYDSSGNVIGTWQVTRTVVVTDTWITTVVFSNTTDFTGAPAGTQITTSSLSTVLGYQGASTRLLLKPGDVFSAASTQTLDTDGPGIIAPWDDSAKAVLQQGANSIDLFNFNHADGWRLIGLHFDGNGYTGGRGLHAIVDTGHESDFVTVYNCTFDALNNAMYFSNAYCVGFSVIECESINPLASSFYQGSGQCLFMGNRADEQDNIPAGHAYRFLGGTVAYGGVISHNRLANSTAEATHAMKIHAQSETPQYGDTHLTSRLVIRGNDIRGSYIYPVEIGPPSAGSGYADEHVWDVLFEDNIVESIDNIPLNLRGVTDITVRNNILIGYTTIAIASIVTGGENFTLENVRLYHNAGYYSGSSAFTFCTIDANYESVTAYGNLAAAPSASSAQMFGGTLTELTEDDNDHYIDPGWMESSPVEPWDFQLDPNHVTKPAVDAAAYRSWMWDTYGGGDRYGFGRGAALDQGPWEIGAEAAVYRLVADAGNGVDAINVLSQLLKQVVDAGAGADSVSDVLASVDVPDASSAADAPASTAALAVADAGQGSDLVDVLSAALKQVTDAGTGADAIAAISAVLDVTDIGAGLDTIAATVTLTLADSAAAADLVDVIAEAIKQVTDAGAAADAIVGPTVSLDVSDAAQGADSPTTTVTLSIVDSGSGVDAIDVLVTVAKLVSDAGAAVDGSPTITVNVPVPESGSAVDAIAEITAALSLADAVQGVDTPTLITLGGQVFTEVKVRFHTQRDVKVRFATTVERKVRF